MALRDQPYIPLYIQDLMTDEKLNNCCAATHGIYIKGLMCLMHKSEEYGKILLQQKFKQTDKQSKNFAIMLVKHLPYTIDEIEKAIDELIEEKVCYFEDDFICQKRMIKDGALSKVRSKVGKLGGEKTKENNEKLLKKLPKQNMQQITEYENEYESEIINTNSSNNTNGEKNSKNFKKSPKPTDEQTQMFEQARKYYPGNKGGLKAELDNFVKKYPDEWQKALPLLLPAMMREKVDKEQKLKNNNFKQNWKHFTTWINKRSWEEEYPNVTQAEINLLGLNVTISESGEQKVEVKQDRSSFPMYQSLHGNPECYPEGTESRCGNWIIKDKKCVRTHRY